MNLGRTTGDRMRAMTPSELYFAFVDQLWPMNIMLVADLGISLDEDHVRTCWEHFTSRRIFTRLIPTPDLTIVDGGQTRLDFGSLTRRVEQWPAAMASEASTPYGLEKPVRLRLLRSPDENRSRLFFVGHHSLVDGRLGISELQLLIRHLAGDAVDEQSRLAEVHDDVSRHEWQTDRRSLMALLRELGESNAAIGEPGPQDWPAPSPSREPRFEAMNFSSQESAAILAAGKEHGVGPFSVMAAAWLRAVQDVVVAGDDAVLQLSTPVDLTRPSAPGSLAPVATGIVSTRYRIGHATQPWALAAQVAARTRRAIDRGEGELFYRLNRADRARDLSAGVEIARHTLENARPAVSVTNLGILDPTGDPKWVNWLCGYLAPTPNQIAFVSGTGYRGRLINSVATDDLRLPPEQANRLREGFRANMAHIAHRATPHP